MGCCEAKPNRETGSLILQETSELESQVPSKVILSEVLQGPLSLEAILEKLGLPGIQKETFFSQLKQGDFYKNLCLVGILLGKGEPSEKASLVLQVYSKKKYLSKQELANILEDLVATCSILPVQGNSSSLYSEQSAVVSSFVERNFPQNTVTAQEFVSQSSQLNRFFSVSGIKQFLSEANQESQNNSSEPEPLAIEVNIAKNQKRLLLLYPDDEPETVVDEFCGKHNLARAMNNKLLNAVLDLKNTEF